MDTFDVYCYDAEQQRPESPATRWTAGRHYFLKDRDRP